MEPAMNGNGMPQRRNIVMLANGHPMFDTRIFIKESVTLTQAGYDVCIILPASGDALKEGVKIIAVPDPATGWKKLIVNPWRILKKAFLQPKSALFVIHDSTILLVGVVLKVSGRRVVYDAHEDTPLQISYQHWLPPVIKQLYSACYFLLEKICGLLFDHVLVAEPVIARYFPTRKTTLIRNFPIVRSFQERKATSYTLRRKQLVNVGTLSAVRGLFEMVEGAEAARKQVDFEFVLGGSFAPPSLEQMILPAYTVNFKGWVSYNQLVELLFESRVGIIITHPVRRYKTNYPVKLFEFMAAGLPVIAAKDTEAAGFVKEADCGILVDPLNIKDIAAAMVWLFTHPDESEAMGRRGQQLIFEKYNWEKESATFLNVVQGLS